MTSLICDKKGSESEKVQSEQQPDVARANFEQIDRQFSELPETSEPTRFRVGESVNFPKDKGSGQLVPWSIVRAEKKHYLLERSNEAENFDHVFCSEEELMAEGN